MAESASRARAKAGWQIATAKSARANPANRIAMSGPAQTTRLFTDRRAGFAPFARAALICRLGAAIFLLIAINPAWAIDAEPEVPANATAGRYGAGWQCDHGFRLRGGVCVALEIPENAYMTKSTSGNGWECRRGYLEEGAACVALELPENAYLSTQRGDAWRCLRGFRQDGERCVAIEIPAHGFLTDSDYGSGWDCERGYRARGDTCVQLKVPENAHIDPGGHNWACDRPYLRAGDACEIR